MFRLKISLSLHIRCTIDLICLQYVTNEGKNFIFHTNKGAQNYRLVKINIDDYSQDKWETLVPEHEKDVLSWSVCVAQDKLVLCYIHDVKVCSLSNILYCVLTSAILFIIFGYFLY